MAFPLSLKFHPQELEITCGARGLSTRCRNRLRARSMAALSISCHRSAVIRQSDAGRFRAGAAPADVRKDKFPATFPSASRPWMTGTESCTPVTAVRIWAGMSSGPSSACWYSPAASGAKRSKNVSRSARTSGAAFSWMSKPAEVCRQNRVKSPVCTPCGASQSKMFCVISTSPRPRDEIRRISTN